MMVRKGFPIRLRWFWTDFYRSSSKARSGSSVMVLMEYWINLLKPTRGFFSLLLSSTDSILNRLIAPKNRQEQSDINGNMTITHRKE